MRSALRDTKTDRTVISLSRSYSGVNTTIPVGGRIWQTLLEMRLKVHQAETQLLASTDQRQWPWPQEHRYWRILKIRRDGGPDNIQQNHHTTGKAVCLESRGALDTYVVCALSLSRVRLFETPWTVVEQASLFMGTETFSRQEYWRG